jgi:hypothetical protein
MGVSFSQVLLGVHTAIEFLAGGALFATGIASMDPEEGTKISATNKLWKRWHASGLLALGYVGLLGLGVVGDGKSNTRTLAVQACGILHGMAGLAQVLALRDGLGTVHGATVLNLHLWMGVGFASVQMGWMK